MTANPHHYGTVRFGPLLAIAALPLHPKSHLTAPILNCLALSHPSTQLNTMTALSHHTMPLEYILAAAASPERTSPFLVATFPTLPVLCTLPALPFRSLTCRSRPIRSSANLPNQASPNETSPDLDCLNIRYPAEPHLCCQTISHPTKPHLYYPLNSSTA
jgi:hypothetical protein